MSRLDVNLSGLSDRRVGRVVVTRDQATVAVLEVNQSRQKLKVTCDIRSSSISPAPLQPDPLDHQSAWPTTSANQAATLRWKQRHPTIVTVTGLDLRNSETPGPVFKAVAHQLATIGVRRLDVLAVGNQPLADMLAREGALHGETNGGVLCSFAVQFPWSSPSRRPATSSTPDLLPESTRRLYRRLSRMRPAQAQELIATAGLELKELVIGRHPVGRTRSSASTEAPPGSHPFAVTRYRVIRHVLGLLSSTLRATGFFDVGAGDGRVMREALAAGFHDVRGAEVDKQLARRAQADLGRSATVVHGDALGMPIPGTVGVVFVNNPFEENAVKRLAANIAESLAMRPRAFLLIYINPPTLEPLQQVGMTLVDAGPAHTILVGPRAQ